MTFRNAPDALSVHAHPASVAWRALNPHLAPPASVETIREGSVYRLLGAVEGSSVIAKRGYGIRGETERTVYEEILSRLPSAGPTFCGATRESDGGWVFTNEVTGQAFRQENPEHRKAVARWLGALHIGIAEQPAILPERRQSYYLDLLVGQRRFLRTRLTAAGIARPEKEVVTSLLAEADWLFSHWTTVTKICDVGPEALVHGDLVAHNVFLELTNGMLRVIAIDWEKSGWGTPAEDLACVDLSTYYEHVQDRLPNLSLAVIQRLALTGRFFRCLVFLDWVLQRFESDHPSAAASDMRLCTSWLRDLRTICER